MIFDRKEENLIISSGANNRISSFLPGLPPGIILTSSPEILHCLSGSRPFLYIPALKKKGGMGESQDTYGKRQNSNPENDKSSLLQFCPVRGGISLPPSLKQEKCERLDKSGEFYIS